MLFSSTGRGTGESPKRKQNVNAYDKFTSCKTKIFTDKSDTVPYYNMLNWMWFDFICLSMPTGLTLFTTAVIF